VLGQVIANGGAIDGKPKLQPFAAIPERLAKVQISHCDPKGQQCDGAAYIL
jgi:hypothetical protein